MWNLVMNEKNELKSLKRLNVSSCNLGILSI
jgi:hypothetical protein